MRTTILLIALVFVAGCIGQATQVDEKAVSVSAPEDLTLTTTDNVKIAVTYYPADGTKGIILLHSLGHDKSDWKQLAPELQKKGFATIAVDLRGHGSSDLNWRSFQDSDFNKMMFDLVAAGNYLKAEGKETVSLIGSSIGANLAVLYANAENAQTAVLLSPGLDYRSVNIESASGHVSIPMLIMVGDGDKYSFESSKTIKERSSAMLKVYTTPAHGTDLLKESDVKEQILQWLEKYG